MGFVLCHFEELDETCLLLGTLKYSFSLFFCVFWFKINEKDKESSMFCLQECSQAHFQVLKSAFI